MKKTLWAGALVGAATVAIGCQSVPPAPLSQPVAATPSHVAMTQAQTTTAATQTSPSKWPADIDAALNRLTARDPAERARALEQLANVIQRNNHDAAQLVDLAAQFKQRRVGELAQFLATEDIEGRALIASLMNFEDALARFILTAAEESEPRRGTLIQWGLSPAGAKVVGQAFSAQTDARISAAQTVVGLQGLAGDWVLGRLIDDTEREVSLTAIDAAWDREPAAPVVEALWRKAVDYPVILYRMNMGMSQGGGPRTLTLHGRTVQLNYADSALLARLQDGDVATDLLLAYKSDLVEKKLDEFLAEITTVKLNSNMNPFQLLSMNNGAQSQNFERLVTAYRPKSAVRFLMRVVVSRFTADGWQQMMNNQIYRFSTRVDAMGLLLKLTEQDKDDYNLVRARDWGNRWMLTGTADDEEKSVKKMLDWWKAHYGDYGASSADLADDEPAGNSGHFRTRGRMRW